MSKSKILVVDDDPSLSRLLAVILNRVGGYDVCEENRSYAALATAREFRPDVVLLDVDMPGKDGGEVARDLAADPQLGRVPILFFTSLISTAEAGQHEVCRSGKMFLAKPVNPVALVGAVGRMLVAKPSTSTTRP